ncbi:TetR/AcrR family transcriptional regulator [Kocuria sp.]|uniref:TetR/AcrR family transcriptional regulator n=1 Tax=Kocuria sp. TaxID=1871328 RepID=UPI0026DEE218|nr:TetR/AcrR family transcriptional regulator [Kocuria sp.]MDO5618482.1 TetR/AcrR family transcriptional regulator [Kocuria sp.]
MSEISDTDAVKRSRVATRHKLVEQAVPVFVAKGLEAASVAELCAAAGFTRGAFYSNFSSKTELAVAVYESRVDGLVALLDTEVDRQLSTDQPVATMLAFVLEAVSGLAQDGAWQGFRMELHLAADRDPLLRSAVDAQYERLVSAVAEMLLRVRRRGVSYRVPEPDLARILLAVWDGELLRTGRRLTAQDGTGRRLITATWNAFVDMDQTSATDQTPTMDRAPAMDQPT